MCRYCPFQEVELNPTLYPPTPGWGRLSDLFPKTKFGKGKNSRLHREAWQTPLNQWQRWAPPVTSCACHPPLIECHEKSASPLRNSHQTHLYPQSNHETNTRQTQIGFAGCMAITPQDCHGRETQGKTKKLSQIRWDEGDTGD